MVSAKIGKIQLAMPFCQAGLAGYSDRAMRQVARRRACPYAVTEALLDVILLSGGQGLRKSIDIDDDDHPVAGQIIGSDPGTMAAAASILAQRGYDVVDLNFACPVKKIKNKARGGHMLQDVPRAKSIISAVRDAIPSNVETTVSLRQGFDESPESADRFYEITEAAWESGYAAIRVHGRTVDQKYQGRAAWSFLAEVKRRYPDRTILGSGDVFTAEDAVRMLHETGVDVVWIARGAIGNPWIFQHAAALLKREKSSPAPKTEPSGSAAGSHSHQNPPPSPDSTESLGLFDETTWKIRESVRISRVENQKFTGSELAEVRPPSLETIEVPFAPPTIHAQRQALTEHFAIAMQIHGEQLAGRRMRKMGIKYSRFHPRSIDVKGEFISVHSLRDWNNVLNKWYTGEGPGVWPDPSAANEVNALEQTCEPAI
jgi:nifR3 family TIM-barrel protein